MKKRILGLAALFYLLVSSISLHRRQMELPRNFPKPYHNLEENPITKQGFDLGKTLFYDPILSSDGSISCGSCHQQWAGFTNEGHTGSHGVNSQVGLRNALPLFNLVFYDTFFWDGGVHNLDLTPLNAIENPEELNESLENILTKLNNSAYYKKRFFDLYKVEKITSEEFLKSLTQFLASMISANSRYDKYVRGEGVVLNSEEIAGMALVKKKCTPCHGGELFTDGSYRNAGVENSFRFDRGRESITLKEEDRGKYRVPTLRNLDYTSPYMHDGSMETLEEVLKHYNSEMEDQQTLDPLFKVRPSKPGLTLSDEDMHNILMFLKTLNDPEFINDRRFSED